MKSYRYEGISPSGAPVTGIVEAIDKNDAIRKAKENCRVLTKLESAAGGKVNEVLNADLGVLISGGKIKPKKLALLSSQLAIELKAGLPLIRALELVAENEEDKHLKGILAGVAEDVESGQTLSRAFKNRAPKLPTTFIETIKAGEASGHLDESFERLKTYYENADAIASKVGSAMIYPALLISVAIVVVIVIMVFAVPVFENSFASLGNELPGPTQLLINMSHFVTDNLMLLICIVSALGIAIVLFSKTNAGQHLIAKLLMTIPGISLVNQMNAAAQFAATMSTMLASGLTMVQAARITADTAENLLIQEALEASAQALVEGRTMSRALRQCPYLPNLLIEMTAVGEQTGKLEETLDVVSEYYTKEVDVAVKRALGILEPAITMFLAAIVVFVLLAVYLPIFSMYSSM